ncbi:hypothetical protein MLD38_035423 [Melastoma candidum]|uniref:Uncharacterized protein n=1 Tax=Melastoma candidum TaxID=119954 RepID=A0ACB9LIA5_9MYRT|nr:hypothetical protein MLD38_035423 [Melastoma candidum]
MEREKLGKIVVLPVFYKVSPGEVRLHEKEKGVKGCYQLAMEEMEALHGTEMANIWRDALWKGGDLIGESVQDGEDEGLVVRRTMKKVLKILNREPLEVAKHPTGIDSRLEKIKPLLDMSPHVDDVLMIGIHGLGGVGKTTLAKAICNNIAEEFDDWCFLWDVRMTDLVISQQSLLRQLLREPDFIVPSVHQGKHLIKERLCHKRVLIILDNLDSSDQLDALAGDRDWIWSDEAFLCVLLDDVVPENYAVKGIVLDLAKKRKKLIKSNTFKFSRRLRLLIVRNAFDPKEPLNFPSELRWLEWPAYSASTMSFGAFSQLVGLDMQRSYIKELTESNLHEEEEEEQEFTELKYVNLSRCESLVTLPDLSKSSKLQELNLRCCKNLEEVRGLPPHLVRLYMDGCQRLRTLPRLHTFMSRTQRIHYVNLSGCQNLGSAYMNESLPYQMVRKFQGVSTVVLPAEEIPSWMNFQTTDCRSNFKIALPEGMVEDDILGLALSINS